MTEEKFQNFVSDKSVLIAGLTQRTIIDILIGDSYITNEKHKLGEQALPYLTKCAIWGIASKFGIQQSGNLSRWVYFSDLLEHCINNDKLSALLESLFQKANFQEVLQEVPRENVPLYHQELIVSALNAINHSLSFRECELVRLHNNRFVVIKLKEAAEVAAPSIASVDHRYIASIASRALKDIENGNFDSAVTKARTLLEEIFCFAIDRCGEKHKDTGNIKELRKQVYNLYEMNPSKDYNPRINDLLNGLNKILDAIVDIRNKAGDAHGHGVRRLKLEKHHARLTVNAAVTLAEFILGVIEKRQKNK